MNHHVSSYTLGLFFIFLVSLIWSAASVLVKVLYQHDFDSPFLLTYVGGALFTIFLPLEWAMRKPTRQSDSIVHNDYQLEDATSNQPPETISPNTNIQPLTSSTIEGLMAYHSVRKKHNWTTRDHIMASAKLAPIWFLANYSYYASLQFISIRSSTVLASTASLFTFGFAFLANEESFHRGKLVGILLGMVGSIWTAQHDAATGDVDSTSSSNWNDDNAVWSKNEIWGDILGLLSAAGWGGYVVLIRVLCPQDESLMNMQLLLGYLGLWVAVALCPIAICQLLSQSPPGLSAVVLGCLIFKGLLDNVLSDYLWARSVMLTSATVANVGLGMTIPMAFLCDVAMGEPDVFSPNSVLGAFFVLVGFVLVNLAQRDELVNNPSPPASLQAESENATFV